MLSLVATVKVKPGQGAAFEEVAGELVAKVNANEKGCVLYVLTRAEADDTYVFLERYLDDEAMAAHVKTEYFKDLGRKMGQFMDGRPQVLRLKDL